ncbi:hypothetical protein CJ030_MR2G026834 [Morella rubra]|uniref:Uncharacterized protein n=1 Tax=Morella rubra TaxID=262757 RepID=A0A6A1WIN9_9ROSI|nr:hypothetical protein CJ030_MR2G026834 [Morella rubra]
MELSNPPNSFFSRITIRGCMKNLFPPPIAKETPYTRGAMGEMCFCKAPLKSRVLRHPSYVRPIYGVHTQVTILRGSICDPSIGGSAFFGAAKCAWGYYQNVWDISHGVSMLAAKLLYDEELESARLKLRRLEGRSFVALSEYHGSSSKREEALHAEVVEVCHVVREVADSFAVEKKNLEENHIGLSLHLALFSTMPAFPGDPVALARRCIGVTMAYLEERSHFKVHKGKHADDI